MEEIEVIVEEMPTIEVEISTVETVTENEQPFPDLVLIYNISKV